MCFLTSLPQIFLICYCFPQISALLFLLSLFYVKKYIHSLPLYAHFVEGFWACTWFIFLLYSRNLDSVKHSMVTTFLRVQYVCKAWRFAIPFLRLLLLALVCHNFSRTLANSKQKNILQTISKVKVACKVQIWKKTFCQNNDKLGYSFVKNDIMFMYLLCTYKKLIILKEMRNSFKKRPLNLWWILNKPIVKIGNVTKAVAFKFSSPKL